jgi:hypothetical protein
MCSLFFIGIFLPIGTYIKNPSPLTSFSLYLDPGFTVQFISSFWNEKRKKFHQNLVRRKKHHPSKCNFSLEHGSNSSKQEFLGFSDIFLSSSPKATSS